MGGSPKCRFYLFSTTVLWGFGHFAHPLATSGTLDVHWGLIVPPPRVPWGLKEHLLQQVRTGCWAGPLCLHNGVDDPCPRLSISAVTHYDQKGLGEERVYVAYTYTHHSQSSKEVRAGTNAEAIEEIPLWLGIPSTRP